MVMRSLHNTSANMAVHGHIGFARWKISRIWALIRSCFRLCSMNQGPACLVARSCHVALYASQSLVSRGPGTLSGNAVLQSPCGCIAMTICTSPPENA
ncbi:hypothetical protein NP493_627g01017 [Ridgeia piscesae]|uniref:Uncharacterized protein n=1 Tax=Ridgeia piscesae TaxID=27915 RepID=A0AAD9NRN7_RIDPI|nr:hypothetical protein NP493_627g01017 [Ridgeia piscesae]